MKKFCFAKNSSLRRRLKESAVAYLFLLPVLLGLAIFTVYPVCASFVYSFFKRFTFLTPPAGIGFFNYVQIFTADSNFYKSVGVTFLYTVINVPLMLLLGFMLAIFLNQKVKGIGAFRVLYYLPVVIPASVIGLLWADLFNYNYGIFNQILTSLGLPKCRFFVGENTAMATLIFTNLWTLGGTMVLWLASLKNVPVEQYEAAELDGAGFFRKTFSVTIPNCSPIIFYNLITGIIASLQTFTNVYAITGGSAGVNDCLYFFVMKIYNETFLNHQLGYGAALSWVFFVIIGLLTLLVFKTSKWVYYDD